MMNWREKYRIGVPRRITTVLSIVFALTLVVLGGLWIAWPDIVLYRFLDAIENSDVSGANAYCDGVTLRVATLSESRRIHVFVRSSGAAGWISVGREPSLFRAHFLRARGRTMTDWAKGEIHGPIGGILYGHLVVKRGQVSFRGDVEGL
ncbi:MAG: hypothetical protein V3R99_04105, partial [Thermoguttaceae bacterium]